MKYQNKLVDILVTQLREDVTRHEDVTLPHICISREVHNIMFVLQMLCARLRCREDISSTFASPRQSSRSPPRPGLQQKERRVCVRRLI